MYEAKLKQYDTEYPAV